MNKFDLRDRDHPAWPIIRLVIILGSAAFGMNFYYAHGYDPIKDTALLATIGAAFGGARGLQNFVCHGTFKDCPEDENKS